MTSAVTRADHLQQAKDRALAHLEPKQPTFFGRLSQKLRHRLVPMAETDQVLDAWQSLIDDLGRHPLTQAHPDIMVGTVQMLDGSLRTVSAMRTFILAIS